MNYPYTESSIATKNGKNQTHLSLSTHILIKTGDNKPVGAVKDITFTEQAGVAQITEVGTDGIVDSCRKEAVKISGNCNRIRYDKMRITEAFGRSFLHLASQAYPLNIYLYDRQAADPNDWIITVVQNVWFNQLTIKYGADDYLISDSCQFTAESIKSYLAGGNRPAATGGVRGVDFLETVPLSDGTTGGYNVEQATDIGYNQRRGSLDISGIFSLGG